MENPQKVSVVPDNVPPELVVDFDYFAVGARGELAPVSTVATAREAHCVTADDRGDVYVCDPEHGRLLLFHDPPPQAK